MTQEPPPPEPNETDRRIGSYRIESSLGKGGMGEVFLAWDERLRRHVAIKRLRTDLPIETAQLRRFQREARAVARLSHPAVVQIYDLLELDAPHGTSAIVMEYVEGQSLSQAIAGDEIDVPTALRLGAEVARGLAEAHGHGLIHRDLKPDNILLTKAGHAKILDFGLARMLWGDAGEIGPSQEITADGILVGTIHAMSPEQASGRPVDHRSDLFALGGVLYEMLTGRAPFRGKNALDSLRRVTSERPAAIDAWCADVSPELIQLVEALLAKEPSDRPPNASIVAETLEELGRTLTLEGAPALLPGAPGTSGRNPTSPAMGELPTGEWPGSVPPTSTVESVVRTLMRTELVDREAHFSRHGDAVTAEVLSHQTRRLRELLVRHGGLEVEAGDSLLALFERPADAVACALAHHRALVELSATHGMLLRARAAVHLGEVLLRHNPEQEVSRGARPIEVEGLSKAAVGHLLALATPCQTLATRGAFDLARSIGTHSDEESGVAAQKDEEVLWMAHGPYLVEGLEEPVEIFEVGLRDLSPLDPPADSAHGRRVSSTNEQRMLGWRPAAGQAIPRRDSWSLIERIGEGGFGEVWLAGHKSGERRVFKFCFEAERLRALKREVTLFRLLKEALGHRKDIARLLDWNFEAPPYFIEAEYTEGGNLAQWAEEQGGLAQVPLAVRIELVAEVAEALAAAHSVGVLHKDVKPVNVLVSHGHGGQPRARLTDFGIGLLTDEERLESSSFTALGFTATLSSTQLSGAGTVGYLAPELMEGQAATVQADVYSLGVLLYQMVVGNLSRTLGPGWEREVDDPLLVEDIAAAVDRDPANRLPGAGRLADRLRRLEQRRQERAERRRSEQAALKAQKRMRWGVGALAVLGLVAGVALFQARRITIEAERANRQNRTAQQVTQLMIDMFQVSDPDRARGETITAREILDRGSKQVREGLVDEPEVRSTLLTALGEVYMGIGLEEDAEAILVDALEAYRQTGRGQSVEAADCLRQLAYFHGRRNQWEESEEMAREALDLYIAALGPDHATVATSQSLLGRILGRRGRAHDAVEMHRKAIATRRHLFGERHPEVALGLDPLIEALWFIPDFAEAEVAAREALAIMQDHYGSAHSAVANAWSSLAGTYIAASQWEQAEGPQREAYRIRLELLAPEHPRLVIAQLNLGAVLSELGRLDEAEALLAAAHATVEEHLPPHDDYRRRASVFLARTLNRQGKFTPALAVSSQAVEYFSHLPETHPRRLETLALHGAALAGAGRLREAEELLLTTYESFFESPEAQDNTAHTTWGSGGREDALAGLITLYEARGQTDLAAHYRDLLTAVRKDRRPEGPGPG